MFFVLLHLVSLSKVVKTIKGGASFKKKSICPLTWQCGRRRSPGDKFSNQIMVVLTPHHSCQGAATLTQFYHEQIWKLGNEDIIFVKGENTVLIFLEVFMSSIVIGHNILKWDYWVSLCSLKIFYCVYFTDPE